MAGIVGEDEVSNEVAVGPRRVDDSVDDMRLEGVQSSFDAGQVVIIGAAFIDCVHNAVMGIVELVLIFFPRADGVDFLSGLKTVKW